MSTITMEINYHYCRLHTAVCPPALRWSVGCNTDWSPLSLSLSLSLSAKSGMQTTAHTRRGRGGPSRACTPSGCAWAVAAAAAAAAGPPRQSPRGRPFARSGERER